MRGRTVAFVWNACVLHIGDSVEVGSHVHSALQLALGAGAPVAAQAKASAWVEDECLVIGSNEPHAFAAAKGYAVLWIEPESDAGRRLTAAYARHRPISAVPVREAEALGRRAMGILADPTSCDTAWNFAADWLAAATGELPRGRVVHPAMRKALRVIEARPRFRISASELAAEVGLSERRLSHLFREQMGVPLRRFLMWQRVREAARQLAQGNSPSKVAYEVGFTDAAHLNRTLKMMLAIRPSDLQGAPPAALHVCSRPT